MRKTMDDRKDENEAKTKWDDKRDRVYYMGTELVNTYKAGRCWHCGGVTQWMDINFMTYLCSVQCTDAKWDEYFKAVTGGTGRM